jgi:sporulation protein YlmC with PRC-barrel domain
MGMRVYASEAAIEGEEFEGVQEGWEDVGEVGDIVMDRDGTVQAVLVDIGGFLGIGERTVAVSMDALRLVSDSETAEDVNDFFLVMNANREALETAPEYVAAQDEGMSAEEAATETDEAIEEGASDAGAAAGTAAGAAVGSAVEGAESAAEEAGDEVAEVGAEVADEAADAGEEVSEEAVQTEMTDMQEDSAEAADESADATEEAVEETAEASEDAAEEVEVTTTESEPQTEAVTEEAATETEMATEETAEAATTTVTTEEGSTEEAAVTEEAEVTEEPARTPVEREGFVPAGAEDFAADRLQGAAVYDANDERVGEVGEILLSDDGQVSDLIVDVGGFLGLGEKPVALPMTSLDILRQDGGEDIRVYVSQTEEELEAMERYESE